MSDKYTYSIQNDFPNHKVETSRLSQEIGNSAIVTALDRIDTEGDVCDIWFKDALSTGDETLLDAVVAAHAGVASDPSAPKVDEEGVMYVAQVPGKPGRKMCITGIMLTAPAGATSHSDIDFAETREVQGAWFEADNHEPGDYVEMVLRGDLGAGEMDLGKFGETVYIPPSGKVDQVVSEGTVSFPPGFKLRMSYVAVAGGATRTLYGWYRMRK